MFDRYLVSATSLFRKNKMNYVNWSEQMSVGDQKIDDQHKKMIEIINTLFEAIENRDTIEALSAILLNLYDYANIHFGEEEEMMREHNYPCLQEHIIEHEGFTGKLKEFKRGLDVHQLCLSLDMLNYLSTWLVTHIQKTDQKYKIYLNGEKGALGETLEKKEEK